jgi:hypothetical protein
MQPAEEPRMIEHFYSVTDPQILLKTRHKLIDIVVITLSVVLAGADEWTKIAEFGKIKQNWFETFFELPSGGE